MTGTSVGRVKGEGHFRPKEQQVQKCESKQGPSVFGSQLADHPLNISDHLL